MKSKIHYHQWCILHLVVNQISDWYHSSVMIWRTNAIAHTVCPDTSVCIDGEAFTDKPLKPWTARRPVYSSQCLCHKVYSVLRLYPILAFTVRFLIKPKPFNNTLWSLELALAFSSQQKGPEARLTREYQKQSAAKWFWTSWMRLIVHTLRMI